MIVCFVDIGGIADHHCLNFLCLVDSGGTVNKTRGILQTTGGKDDPNIT